MTVAAGKPSPSRSTPAESPPRPWRRLRSIHPADAAAALSLVLLAAFYFRLLDGYLINDDEGSYLYAAWRISLGEVPYRDFLTPQLPAFLLPGGWLMTWLGPSAWAARAVAAGLTLASGALVWATARRLFGPGVAWLAGGLFLLHPEIFLHGRTFRSEPFMLFFAGMAVWAFARGAFPRPRAVDPPSRRWLAVSGLAFGLATLAKLFGPLPMGGCLLWLVVDGWRRGRPPGAMVRDGLAVVLPWAIAVAAGLGVFAALGAPVYESVLGHHLRQGAGKSEVDVLGDTIAFYTYFLRYNEGSLLLGVALAAGLMAWRRGDRPALLFACQLPTLLAFAVLSRDKFPRHFMYIVPTLAVLYAVVVRDVARIDAPRPRTARSIPPWAWLAVALVLAPVVPWRLLDRDQGSEIETGTRRLADFIDAVTAPDEIVLSDYSELNFYALRPTTYAAASLSAGAAGSGQITWARLEGELGGRLPPLVLLDLAEEYSHTHFLQDRPAFEAWLDANYDRPVGRLRRHSQLYDVYAPIDRPLPVQARFRDGPVLLSARPEQGAVGSGESVDVVAAWQMPEPIGDDLGVTVRMVGADGVVWAQADDGLYASDPGAVGRVRPTSQWGARELTSDRVTVTVPPGTPAGVYDLVLGLYRRSDLEEVVVVDEHGSPQGTRLHVGRLTVRPWAAPPGDVPDAALDLDLRAPSRPVGGVSLLGRGPLPVQPVGAGELLRVDLWWHVERATDARVGVTLGDAASGAIAADWTARLAPRGADGGNPAGASGGDDGAPAAVATRGGVVFRQKAAVPVLAQAGGGTYRLGVTVIEVDGQPVGDAAPVDLGTVTVVPRDLSRLVIAPPPLARVIKARLDGIGDLLGVNAPDGAARVGAAPGGSLDVELVWRASGPTAVSYAVTVQLLGADGRPAAQHDSVPAAAKRPTTGWVPGEIVVDRHRLPLPADLPPGTYTLIAALYDPMTGVRRAAVGADAAGDAIDLGTVDVR